MAERGKGKRKVKTIGLVILVVCSAAAVYVYRDKFGNNLQTDIIVLPDDSPEEELLNPTTEKVQELIKKLDESMIQGYLEKLTSFGPHPTARRILYKLSNRPIIGKFFDLPIEKVAKYIYKEFESMGLDVEYQYWEQEVTLENLMKPKYYPGWLVGNNVVATLPGTDKSSDEIYIVIAHYDTMPVCPGANDDSTGVAAVLASAKLMSKYSFNHTVRFIATDGEEQGLLGSRDYAEKAAKNNDNIVAVICIDMIGNQGPGFRDDEILIAGMGQSSWISDLAADANQRYSEYLNFTIFQDEPTNHGSDHRGFLEEGYDAVFFAEAIDDYDWHRSSDVLKNMNVTYATKASKLVLATLAELAWGVGSR